MNDEAPANPKEPFPDSRNAATAALEARTAAQAQELEALRRTLAGTAAGAQGIQRTLRTRQRELDQLRGTLSVALRTLREQLERVERSAAWRYGHAASRSISRLRGRRVTTSGGVLAAIGQVDRILELLGAEQRADAAEDRADAFAPSSSSNREATRGDEILLGQRVRDGLGPAPAGEILAVAIVIASRSRERIIRILDRLAETDYPPLEVIIVDNASAEREVSRLAQEDSVLEITIERLDSAASFAEASNRGAELAQAELLLFLNDDVAPVEPGWLRELVSSLRDGDAEIVGATLVDPRVDSHALAPASGWTLEQRGIGIAIQDEELVPVRQDAREDVFGARFGIDVPAVAVSGACVLVSKSTFESLGAFDTGYQFGLEDVDLCLRARARGFTVSCCGRAIVVHEGSASQSEAGREFRRINRAINRKRFRQLWGPTLRRDRVEGLLRGDPAWGQGPRLAIARTSNDPRDGWGDYYTGQELGDAAAAMGWRVTYVAEKGERAGAIPADLDVAVVLTDRWDAHDFPASTLMCAWIRNWTERWLTRPWLDRYDVLLASSGRSAELLIEATGRPVQLFALATNARRFHPPAPSAKRRLDWVFTGNRWGEPRVIEDALVARRRDPAAIYGRGWQDIKRLHRLARGPVSYEELPAIYGAAKVVLDDTAEPTLPYDAVNSRVFDALACGALVLSNCAAGVHELFDEEFPTWSSAGELSAQLAGLLAAPDRRTELVSRYRQTVIVRHTYGHRARALRRIVRSHNQRLSFCLKIGAPDWKAAQRWGDLHFALGLSRALARLGHRSQIGILPEWESPASSMFDVVVHLRGRSEYAPCPGQFNVLWLISHPETFSEVLADGFDLVCVASAPFAAQCRDRISAPVQVLEQASDPRVFFPDPDPELVHELVFVGNSRGVRRKILDDLLPTDRDLAAWGSGWRGTPVARHLIGEHIPNEELRKVYSSAAIVLCDHWPDMRTAGFRSNRLYDALACGAIVVSDRVAGLDDSLGEAVLTYEDPDELRSLLARLLEDPDERARRAHGARQRILDGETFDDRARDLVRWVSDAFEPLSSARDHVDTVVRAGVRDGRRVDDDLGTVDAADLRARPAG